jgi:predicted nucleotidyltransferase component of viral defense system
MEIRSWFLSVEDRQTLVEVQQYFGLPSLALVEKDYAVVRAIQALSTIDATPFRMVFGGGTALARAHRLIQRMSEDVDFKVVPLEAAPISTSKRRRELSSLRDKVTSALHQAGFNFDPTEAVRSRDANQYIIFQLPYDGPAAIEEGLRPTIQIELNHTRMRQPIVELPVASFVSEALKRAAEVPRMACVSLAETAAEKNRFPDSAHGHGTSGR